MIVLRWIVALATVAYALWDAIPGVATAVFKLGKLPPSVAKACEPYVPLMQSVALWQVGVWLLAVLVYLFAALRLVTRPREAFGAFIFAAILDVGGFIYLKLNPLYDKTMPAAQLRMDYYLGGAVVVLAILYFAFSRTRTRRVQPAVLSG